MCSKQEFGLFVVILILAGCSSQKPAPPETPAEKPLRCEVSKPETCDVEGMRWENGMGRSRSKNEAARYYAVACEADYTPGCAHLGALYFEAGDLGQARALYKKACAEGDAESCGNIAYLVSQDGDHAEARKLYSEACDEGAMSACANLADMHQAARGGDVDHDRAQALFEKSCVGGNASACIRWSWSVAMGCSGDACSDRVEDEKSAAAKTAKHCTETNSEVTCTGYGVHLESGSLVKKDPEAARTLYEAGCAKDFAWACERLGTAHVRGVGGPRDASLAVQPFTKACDAGFAAGCSGLAALYVSGDGVERDDAKAGELLGKACGLHDQSACNTKLLFGL